MIAYIKGEVASIAEDSIVLEVNNIGYNIKVAASTINALAGISEEVRIHTYTYVREDAFQLYGFLTKDDLHIFKLLINVNGIGPKGALAVLSIMSADDLRFAIISGDAKAIAKAPGVGAKTAERVILDLRDKVSIEDTFTAEKGALTVPAMEQTQKNDAVEALVALGYSGSEALRAVKQVEITEDMDIEAVLKQALKKLF